MNQQTLHLIPKQAVAALLPDDPQASPLLNEKQAAAYLNLSVHTLRRIRADKAEGPAHVQLSDRRIAFRRAALDAWALARENSSAETDNETNVN